MLKPLYLEMLKAGVVSRPQAFFGTHASFHEYVRAGAPFGAYKQ